MRTTLHGVGEWVTFADHVASCPRALPAEPRRPRRRPVSRTLLRPASANHALRATHLSHTPAVRRRVRVTAPGSIPGPRWPQLRTAGRASSCRSVRHPGSRIGVFCHWTSPYSPVGGGMGWPSFLDCLSRGASAVRPIQVVQSNAQSHPSRSRRPGERCIRSITPSIRWNGPRRRRSALAARQGRLCSSMEVAW